MWLRIFHKVVKTGFYMFRRPFWWKKNIFENWFFFEIWAIFFPTFGKKYFANLAELLSKRSDEQYDVQPTTSLKSSSYLFGFWPKLFLKFRILFFAKVWKLFSKNWYEHFIQKIFFEKFSSKFFGIRSKHFVTFGKKSTERLSDLFSTSSKICWRNRLFQFCFLFVVQSDFEQNFSDMSLRIFHKAVISGSYVFRRPFWWKKKYFESCFFS